jgi:hypothetical protein
MIKKAIVIFRELELNDIEFIKHAISTDSIDVFALEKYANELAIHSLPVITIDIEPEEKRKINYDIIDKVNAFGDRVISDDSISNHFAIDDFSSIWYYHKFRLYFTIRNKYYEIRLINKLFNRYDVIDVFSSFNLMEHFSKKLQQFLPSRKSKINFKSVFKFGTSFLLRVYFDFIQFPNLNKKFLLLDKGKKQPIILSGLSTISGNYNLEYLFRKIDNTFAIANELEIPKFDSNDRFRWSSNLFKKRKTAIHFFSERILFLGLFNVLLSKEFRIFNHKLRKKYKEFTSILKSPLERDIINEIAILHRSSLFYAFRYLSYRSFFAKHTFKVIASIDENSPTVKTIFDAAKANRIVTIGIQHGNIHDLHPAYLFTKIDSEKMIVPDVTLVWGDYWKKFLVEKGHYPASSIYVTGQIRSDIIPVLIGSKFSLFDNETKNIVFATQPQRDKNLRYRAAVDVFNAMYKLGSGYTLYLKLHPSETQAHNYYRSIAEEVGYKEFKFVDGVDLYRIIASCDVLITCFSTVGAEAVYFKKPLIILDHLRQDIQRYHKEGVAKQATNPFELESYIKQFCNGELSIDYSKYDQFIRNYAFRIDGKVSERVVEQIKKIGDSK